ncbi:transposase [Paludisphaera mucosa]|uniref:Transposase n=1 Tax=Paludisphaera mucosa TaxID=3030827 RepID=A0ABT6F9E4_9BACT|nr:transposase [Paludisphaera mucosa]MDG3004000.1 transposase [Paludisphaera mucosa]
MVRGRKRHVVTDTVGLLLIVVVTAANADDGATAPRLLAGLPAASFPRLSVVWADRKYRNNKLDEWLAGQRRLRLEISSKPEGAIGFKPLKKRWAVEQTFGCMLRLRRLVRDLERLATTSAAMVKLSAIHRMVRRASPPRGRKKFRFKRPPKAAA